VVAGDGQPVDLGPAKCQAVLATLAVSPGVAVPVWRLVETVWGEEPPRTAERTLQSYVARLRKALGREVITRTGAAYRLNVDTDGVDVTRFERLLDEGRVDEALAEWTGPPLAGLDVPGLAGTVTGLTERWLTAVEAELEHRVDVDPASAIGDLTELTATHPFREGMWALLMTALYRVGRQADALAAYRTAGTRLGEELGVEPGPRLRQLELRILRHEQDLGAEPSPGSIAADLPAGTVTFAFTDVKDATPKWFRHREAMSEAMARHHALLRSLAIDHGGHVVIAGGDSYGLVFAAAGHAAAWAVEVQGAMSAEAWPAGLDLAVCIGIHTGEADERNGGYFGPAVNLAQCLATAGHGNQTLLSGTTAGLLENVTTVDLGWYRFNGVVAEQHIFQLGRGAHPALLVEDLFRGNLPHRLGRLIGRSAELNTILEAVAAYPVVTLIGPGGIGKTTLALSAADRAMVGQDGWLVDLTEIDSSDQVPRAVADTLGVGERPGVTLIRSIVDTLGSRRTLLVLDNCEHVVEAAAEVAQAIARGCEHVRIVATSRERLGVTNERIIVIPPLDPTGPAVELFNERAAAVSGLVDPEADRPAVEEICSRLDGIPLAIELAAARTPTFSPADLVERLEHHPRLLDGVRRTGIDRHRTLRSAIQWSYDLLTTPEQVLFRQLSIFAGPFGLTAAEQVAFDPALDPHDVDRVLSRLVEQSMLTVEPGPFGPRFRLLEPIREFGASRLDRVVGAELAERHATWCLSEVSEIHRLLAGWGEIEGVARLAELWPNLREAFHRACGTGNRRLARALVRPILAEIILRSRYELGDWLEYLLATTPQDDEEGLIFGLYWAAHRYSVRQDPDGYRRLVERHGEPDHVLVHHGRATAMADYQAMAEWAPQAVEELRRSGDDHLAERAEINVVTAWLNLGRYEDCDARLQQLLARYRAQGPPTFVNWILLLLGYSASFQGGPARADTYFDEAVDIEVPPGTYTPNKPLEARAAFRRGNHLRAYRTLRSHIDELLATDNMQGGRIDCIEFVNMMARVGRFDEADRVLTYLENNNLLDTPAWRGLVEDSAAKISSAFEAIERPEDDYPVDDRRALEYVGKVLDRLATELAG
jgi:predicted ATPase/DNA-binding SARP family transcriptional activator